jgi:cellulose synthase/poly-beta-1,6-N-acetylglucosamine synthase-like glycosyltransferase
LSWAVFFVAPALALALFSLFRSRKPGQALRLSEWPPATVIVPVKGPDEDLRRNLAALASLDYPDYELIIAARRAADIPAGVLPDRVRVVLAGETDSETSEKILNLLAAVQLARRPSAVFAFADSDGRVPKEWLRALVAPLWETQVGASTGYRWYAPDPPDICSLLRAVWNGAILGNLRAGDSPFAWGGAMAIRRDVFRSLGIAECWKGQVSDDYVLTHCVQQAGLRIVYTPEATVVSSDHIGFRELLRWTARQMRLTKAYKPRLWWIGFAAHCVYCAGMVASIAAGWWWALALQLAPGMWKAGRRGGWPHVLLAPLATWLWMWSLAASVRARSIEWRGRRYRLRPIDYRRRASADSV